MLFYTVVFLPVFMGLLSGKLYCVVFVFGITAFVVVTL